LRRGGTLVARRDSVEPAGRQNAAQQRRHIGRHRNVISGLWPAAFKRADEFQRDRFGPKLEGLVAAFFEPGDTGLVDFGMGRGYEVDITPIGFERMFQEA
jgi:hypothetical protein